MAFVFTFLYVVTAYVTPPVIFGPLAPFHVEIILAFLAVLFSIPNISKSGVLTLPQSLACLALAVIVPVSFAASGWLSGVPSAAYGFLPTALAFFLAAMNCKTPRHLQWLVLGLLLGSTYFIVMGSMDLRNHVIPSEFLYGDGTLRRLRGLGFVHDPNDLSQVMVSLIPLVFLWKSSNKLVNVLLLGVPIAILITGMYLTHSRGAAIALMATIVVAARRKIGTVPAVIVAGSLFAASLAVGWSGGRDVSMEAGADRLDAWSTGIQFIKTHPLLGVGSGRFSDFNDITAHNTIVVCAAEIGLPGFVCWVLFVFATLRSGINIGGAKEAKEASSENSSLDLRGRTQGFPGISSFGTYQKESPIFSVRKTASLPLVSTPATKTFQDAATLPLRQQRDAVPNVPQEEVRRMARLLVTSLTGFLVAGWFLSRALSMWLFLYCGMMHAISRMAIESGIRPKHDSFAFLVRWSSAIAAGLVLLVYVTLRARTILGH